MTFTILNTRPKHQAESLTAFITHELKALSVELPLLEITPHPTKDWISNLPDCHIDLVIFTSTNAVHHSIKQIKKHLSQVSAIAAIGSATAQCLQTYGIKVDIIPQLSNSESLIDALSLQKLELTSVIIVKGEGGRNKIQTFVRQLDIPLTELNVYKRTIPAKLKHNLKKIWKKQPIDLILIYSVDALKHLIKETDTALIKEIQKTPCLVLSDRIKNEALNAGIQDVITAVDHSMAQSVKAYMIQRKLL